MFKIFNVKPYTDTSKTLTMGPITQITMALLICSVVLVGSSFLQIQNNDHETNKSVVDGDVQILTILTTYSKRSSYAKANKEVVEERMDDHTPRVFIASDKDDQDMDEMIDFKFGEARHHRLLASISEVSHRHKGEFDWIAIGDDDTVFMYNRAKSFLKHIDHTKPVAIGSIDGITKEGRAMSGAKCLTPSEKDSLSTQCCRDFTSPCEVPAYPDLSDALMDLKDPDYIHSHPMEWVNEYGLNGLFWPYGGAGTFLSSGLVEKIGESGWNVCTEVFGEGYDTDIQLAMCLRAHGLTMSTYREGFDHSCRTSDPDSVRKHVSEKCQILGIHLGLRHLDNGGEFTVQSFKDAATAVNDEDKLYLERDCPEELESISMWM